MQRTIKSFVLRTGRITHRQQHALDHWLEDYTLPGPSEAAWTFADVFGREADTVLEIGFGMGASLSAMAKQHPEWNFIGVEVHRAGIGSFVADLHEQSLTNVRIAPYDAVDIFNACVPDASLSGVQIFFPDPWPKKKHHKRRLIQSPFVSLIVQKLKVGGFLHCATDWESYANQMLEVLSAEPGLYNSQSDGGFIPRPETRPVTKFEQRGCKLGHSVWDLKFIRYEAC